MNAPFKSAWWSFDLGVYRPCDGTYRCYTAESLPPVDARRFTGDFAWLRPTRGRARAGKPPALVATTKQRGVLLPAAFVRFMTDRALQDAVPSCTACEWDLSAAPVPCRVVPGAFTVRFLRDQQDCLFWYLHIQADGAAQILCSPIPFDDPALAVTAATVLAHTWTVAAEFEAFVHRFWLENQIWEQLHTRDPRWTAEQRAYLDHYAGAVTGHKPAQKVAMRGAKKATAPRPIKRTAAARIAAERERAAKRQQTPPIGGAVPR